MRTQRGFTLAEVLIAVAVLGVLIGVGIPVYRNAVASSQANTCAANRAMAETEADAAAMSQTAVGDINDAMRAKLSAHFDKGHKNPDICPAGGYLTVSADGKRLYCSIHDRAGAPNIYLQEALKDLPGKTMVDIDGTPVTAPGAQKKFNIVSAIDSTAPSQGGGRSTTILHYFKQNGIDLDVLNIKTWAVKESGGALYWSDQVITELKPGDKIRVMKFNTKNGNYTAGYMTLEEKVSALDSSITYMQLKDGTFTEYKTKDVVQTNAAKKDYYATLDTYEAMPARPE